MRSNNSVLAAVLLSIMASGASAPRCARGAGSAAISWAMPRNTAGCGDLWAVRAFCDTPTSSVCDCRTAFRLGVSESPGSRDCCGYCRFAHIDDRIAANLAQYVGRSKVHPAETRGMDRGDPGVFLFARRTL